MLGEVNETMDDVIPHDVAMATIEKMLHEDLSRLNEFVLLKRYVQQCKERETSMSKHIDGLVEQLEDQFSE